MISEPTPNATQKKKTRDMLAKGKEKRKKKSTCKRLTRETTLNSDQMLGLLHTLNDSLDIQRPDTPKVDDLNLDTLFLLQQLGSLERVGDHLAVGDDGNVGTSLFNLGLADGDEEVLGEFFLGHGEMDTVEELVLKETNLQTEISFREIKKKKNGPTYRVRVPDSALQQTLAVGSAPGGDDLQTGNTSVPRTVVLRVLGGDTGSGTVGTTEDDGTGDVTTRHVVGLTTRVDDLIDRLHGKVPGHCVRCLSCEKVREKRDILNSQMGRRPARAAPTAIPVKPASVMGV